MDPPARYPPAALAFILLFFVGAFVSTRLLNSNYRSYWGSPVLPKTPTRRLEFPLNCTAHNLTGTCPSNYPTTSSPDPDSPAPPTCPEYFRWIHENLKPWARTGITRETFQQANRTANFKLVIVNGKAYMERYEKSFESRDTFTLWGIIQLLRRYPGKVPDLELMFDCVDWPVILSKDYSQPNSSAPPPLFRYCKDNSTLDIPFPDWSFWGWPETNIGPWEKLLKQLEEGNKRRRWEDREPYAYWKGNPEVAESRQDLLKCNVSAEHEWNARLYTQNWTRSREIKDGFKKSDLTSQCVHRYKIYIEGSAWSVSNKYILACDSETLLVKPRYYDFFMRGWIPMEHYWPIKVDDKCRSIKFAVDWGNSHKQKAQEIGKAASTLIQEDLNMDNVYDYMLHLLTEYAKLLQFKPTIPKDAVELCPEAMACKAEGLEKKFMLESLVKGPANVSPCVMPLPYDPASLFTVLKQQSESIKRVETLEKNYWDNQNKKP